MSHTKRFLEDHPNAKSFSDVGHWPTGLFDQGSSPEEPRTYPRRLSEVQIPGVPELVISHKLQAQIDYLHSNVGTMEWSGILLYKIFSGTLADPANMKIVAKQLFLMNIGSSTYTEFFTGVGVLKMYDMIPDAEYCRMGLIHSHHNMGAFFSGTDIQELHDNSPYHAFYLSLIVDFQGTYKARIAIEAEAAETIKIKDVDSQPIQVALETKSMASGKVLGMIDIKVINPPLIDNLFKDHYHSVANLLKKPVAPTRVLWGEQTMLPAPIIPVAPIVVGSIPIGVSKRMVNKMTALLLSKGDYPTLPEAFAKHSQAIDRTSASQVCHALNDNWSFDFIMRCLTDVFGLPWVEKFIDGGASTPDGIEMNMMVTELLQQCSEKVANLLKPTSGSVLLSKMISELDLAELVTLS